MKLKILLFLIGFVSISYAWGPNTHMAITEQALSDAPNTIIKQIITDNIDAYYAGLMFPDVTVIYYYTNFKTYRATHNWDFFYKCLELAVSDDERAFCYGIGTHMAQDCVAHNKYVPLKLHEFNMPNWFFHPLVEAKVESHYLRPETTHAMDSADQYMPLTIKALNRDFTSEMYTLRTAIGGQNFYNTAYAAPTTSPLYGIYNWFCQNILVKLWGAEDAQPYLDEASELTLQLYQGTYPLLDPSGAKALHDAEKTSKIITNFLIVAGLLFFAPVFYKIYKKIRGKK